MPVQTGCAVFCDQRGLDGEGPAAAEGVSKFPLPPVACKRHHGGGQRFPQGGGVMRRAVATLVQALAARVKAEGDLILHDRKADLHGLAGLRKPLQPVAVFQTLRHGLFDDLLAVRDREEPGVEAVPRDGEGCVLRDHTLPGQRLRALEKRVEALRLEGAELEEHALAGAEPEVGLRRGLEPAGKIDAAVFSRHLSHPQPPQLVGRQPFQTEQTGDAISKVHGLLPYHTVCLILQQIPRLVNHKTREKRAIASCPEQMDENKLLRRKDKNLKKAIEIFEQ